MSMNALMSRHMALSAGLGLLAGLLAFAAPLQAADEDTSSSVYLVFDPETGEFKTEHDPNMTQAEQATKEAINSVADVPAEVSADPAADGGGATTQAGKETAGTTWVVLAAMIGLVLFGGLVVLRSRRSSS